MKKSAFIGFDRRDRRSIKMKQVGVRNGRIEWLMINTKWLMVNFGVAERGL